MSMLTPTDPFEGLDPFVRDALSAWQSLTAEQRDYAMGFVCAWAPDVVLSASRKSVEISRIDHELAQIGAGVETETPTPLDRLVTSREQYLGWDR
ncbi:hypothetical protein ACFYO1_08050 [Nocardia sp. NPDC006044]|uniref:hypothetical protein n=1 Tax=Nocardia sp. NPDC006044 TaxID=3364306 RepID=UPI0036A28905